MKKLSIHPGKKFRLLRNILGGIALIVLMASCAASRSVTEEPGGTSQEPAEMDDPYFTEVPVIPGELFRILITENSYLMRQMGEELRVRRAIDTSGDEEQLQRFREFGKNYNFGWVWNGILSIKVNPETRVIEHIEYVPGHSPKSWQASKYFLEDVSRLRFEYLRNGELVANDDSTATAGFRPSPLEFKVRYKWIIKREEGLSEEEAKERVIEYLKNQMK